MMRNLLLCSLLTLSAFAQTTQTTPPAPSLNDSWERLHLLLGTWKAETTAQGIAAARVLGTYTFQYDLNHNVITRTSSVDACKGPATYDCQHHDTLILYRNAADPTPHAFYADSEGHVIHYDVATPDANTVILFSNAPGPRFRLVYHFENNLMSGKFQIMPPGSPDFKSYLEWFGGRQ